MKYIAPKLLYVVLHVPTGQVLSNICNETTSYSSKTLAQKAIDRYATKPEEYTAIAIFDKLVSGDPHALKDLPRP